MQSSVSLCAAVLAARPHLPLTLLSPQSFSRVLVVAGELPAPLRQWGLECRLDPADDRVDLGVVVTARDGGHRVFAQFKPAPGAVPSTSAAWRAVRRFCRSWSSAGSPLYRRVPHIFLEFDLEATAAPFPGPGVFVTLERIAWQECDNAPERQVDLAVGALELLNGEALPAPVRDCVTICYRQLPPGGMILHVGTMPNRVNVPFRIYAWIPSAAIPSYLRLIGIDLETELAGVGDLAHLLRQAVGLQMTITDRLEPQADIEITFREQPVGEPGWRMALRYLCDRGLCGDEKAEALLAWPGETLEVERPSTPRFVRRALSHLKVTLKRGQVPHAKAYIDSTFY
jgi:hypothetical protein